MDRGKPSVSGVSESGPAQAVDSLMVSDTYMASETLESYLGRLLKSDDAEMSAGHLAMSFLCGIVGPRNIKCKKTLLSKSKKNRANLLARQK